MKVAGFLSTALAAAAIFAKSAVSADVPSIVIKGSKFFYENNGTQFYMKGIAYQQDYSANSSNAATTGNSSYIDPLADESSCNRDIPYLVQLGTNTIRVYAIDPTKDHDACMTALANAGIYVIADLSAPGDSIVRDDPTWNDDLYARYTSVVDTMQKYTNTLGFFAGNEVSNNNTNTDASAFVKAAARDIKAYIKQKNYRTIGVGYATNDDAAIRVDLASYFDCAPDGIDFWGYNIYSWCGDSSFTESGYDVRTKEFENWNIPVFFAEYGCNEVQPRQFTEVQALYGPDMENVWSGGIVYMYFQEANDYGLVSVDGNSVSTLADFNNLASQIASISPTGINSASYNPTNTAPASCPSVGSAWQAAASPLPPTPNQELCECMYKALTCVPASSVQEEQYGELFGVVCGLGDSVCEGIQANATEGTYGAYGMCNPQQQLGWALNVYYNQQGAKGNGANACDFSGSATTQAAATPTGDCKGLISQAGQNGQGTVTSVPTSISGNSGGSGSGSGSSSGSGSKSGNAASSISHYSNIGYLHVAAYVVVAFCSGMGMIFL